MHIKAARAARLPADGSVLFGHPNMLAALLEIARGPLHVRELARRIGVSPRRAFNLAQRFIGCGVVAKRELGGGYLIVALDPRYPANLLLRRLLRRLGAQHDDDRV